MAPDVVNWELRWNRAAELNNIAVGQRREGHGTRLLEQAIVEMRQNNVRYVYLFTELSNIGAQQFYKANGFDQVARLEYFYGHDRPALMYGKVIE